MFGYIKKPNNNKDLSELLEVLGFIDSAIVCSKEGILIGGGKRDIISLCFSVIKTLRDLDEKDTNSFIDKVLVDYFKVLKPIKSNVQKTTTKKSTKK